LPGFLIMTQFFRNHPLIFLVSLVLLTAGCSFSLAEDITPPPGAVQSPVSSPRPAQISGPLYPLVSPDPANGAAIYAEKCAPCHGDTGKGDGPRASQLPSPVIPLGSPEVARQATPAGWYTMVTQGNLERFMPPFASLSDGERWDVVAYALSLSAPQAMVEQGAELYQANCAECHGKTGVGDGPQAAGLPASLPDITDQQFMAQKTAADFYQVVSNGAPPSMPAFADRLSDDERWALTAYLRSLTLHGSATTASAQDTSEPVETVSVTQEITPTGAKPAQGTPIAEAPDNLGKVVGSVVNASSGDIPTDLEIMLRGFDDMVMVLTQTTTLDAQGFFTFTNVEMPPGRAFIVTTDYDNSLYSSDVAIAQQNLPRLELPVTIYETSTDTSVLTADRLHLFFEPVDEKTMRIIELYILSNPTNKTLVPAGEGQPTVSFSLPEGATNLEFQDGALGGRYIKTEDGFGDTAPIRPGSGGYELLFAYEMPYDRKLDLVQTVPVPVGAVVVLVPENGIKVKGATLVDEGTRDVQGAQYRMYNGSSIPAGSNLSLTISGHPTSSSPSLTTGSSTNLVIGLAVFGIALIVAGVWIYRRSRVAADESVDEEEDLPADDFASESDSVETLMDAIIALDDQYQDGQLPENAYLERRAKLKERLNALMDDKKS
jgi:mono/diheme cytochrome c family protein